MTLVALFKTSKQAPGALDAMNIIQQQIVFEIHNIIYGVSNSYTHFLSIFYLLFLKTIKYLKYLLINYKRKKYLKWVNIEYE